MAAKEKVHLVLAPREIQAVGRLLSCLKQTYGEQIQQAILFGSKARGEATHDSDIDVLLLVENENWKLKDEIIVIVADVNLEYDLQIDLRIIGIARWKYMAEIQAGLYRNISQDAIPLAG